MFLDIGVGILIGVFVGFFSESDVRLTLIIFGGFSAVIPDLDFLIYLSKRNWKVDEFTHEHRDLFHNPIIFSLGGGVILLFVNTDWSLIWAVATFLHFIHDTLQHGWGIRWGYPFDKRYFTLASYSPQWIIVTKEEQRKIAIQYGNPEWLREGYFQINPKLILELIFLAVSSLIAFWWIT